METATAPRLAVATAWTSRPCRTWRISSSPRRSKDEVLSHLILFGEGALRHTLHEYVNHYHYERNHQDKGNVLLFPSSRSSGKRKGLLQCRERLGGLLKYYEHDAA
jgi:hypothetical protein